MKAPWSLTVSIKELIGKGYRLPLGELVDLGDIFRKSKLGQILDGEDLREIGVLLSLVKQVQNFSADFSDRFVTLRKFERLLYALPRLSEDISRCIGPDGELLDEASPELARIRRQKVSIKVNIETKLKRLLTDGGELETYLQDDFFTVRSDRYVVPMRLDGRGRVKGTIHDTSDSGQTLFIEPDAVKDLNDSMLDLELSEKLEIIRIFKELSESVREELETLKNNYVYLVELDFINAKASLANTLDAGTAIISDKPCLKLLEAKHPLLQLDENTNAVGNNIELSKEQKSLVVSGPNAGGKTVVLKTVGMLHLMAKAGLLLPVTDHSEIYLFKNLWVEVGDAQNLEANLSTFSGHLMGLKPILEGAQSDSLVLLDELAVGTDPQTGQAIGQAVLEELTNKNTISVVTTHFDNLKGLAEANPVFRNGSMEFSKKNLRATYKLVLDIPGQSFGIEVAENLGLPSSVLQRAKELRGQSSTSVDQLVEKLQQRREEAESAKAEFESKRLEMEERKYRWEEERKNLEKAKSDASQKIRQRYEGQIDDLKREFNKTLEDLKTLTKSLPRDHEARQTLSDKKREAFSNIDSLNKGLSSLSSQYEAQKELPGRNCIIEELKPGQKVYIVSLGKEATITKVQKGDKELIEVSAGLLKLRPSINDLRLIEKTKKTSVKRPRLQKKKTESKEIGLVIPSPSNSLDLRGLDADRAIEKTWNFIDKALLSGTSNVIIIHGHGTATLKKAIRSALLKDCPYDVDFRAGEREEGGDGVTVVQLRS